MTMKVMRIIARSDATLAAKIQLAIENRRLIEIRYSGAARIVEPHDYGLQHGREHLLVFQLRGPARPRQSPIGWRMLDVTKIETLIVLDETFVGSRGQSHRDHNAWEVLYARVK
jgi:hypothetical protein